ncbi:MAG: hypothetical protein BWY88_00435 [Synergistetes bacterium ADurb.Bin520]|nr:MAG: hypothetical protein BWY88_00435 [Synergistetes bacterium ADurb.Bin520]
MASSSRSGARARSSRSTSTGVRVRRCSPKSSRSSFTCSAITAKSRPWAVPLATKSRRESEAASAGATSSMRRASSWHPLSKRRRRPSTSRSTEARREPSSPWDHRAGAVTAPRYSSRKFCRMVSSRESLALAASQASQARRSHPSRGMSLAKALPTTLRRTWSSTRWMTLRPATKINPVARMRAPSGPPRSLLKRSISPRELRGLGGDSPMP